MRVVLDTNTVISGLLWHGPPRRILNLAREGQISLAASSAMLAELSDVFQRKKFAARLEAAGVTMVEIVREYAVLTIRIEPATIEPIIVADPDDDVMLQRGLAVDSQRSYKKSCR